VEPQNLGGDWIHGEGVVGATFRGHNRGREGEFETILTVTEAEPASRFAFTVAPPGEVGTAWSYNFRSDRGGTTLTESFEWHWTPLPDEGFRARVGRLRIEDAARMVSERERHLRDQVNRTLVAIKRALEARASTRDTP
jgi:hypothetical protein